MSLAQPLHGGRLLLPRRLHSDAGRDVERQHLVDRAKPVDHAHEDVYVAIRDAFDAAVRRLEDQVRRVRGNVKSHAAP